MIKINFYSFLIFFIWGKQCTYRTNTKNKSTKITSPDINSLAIFSRFISSIFSNVKNELAKTREETNANKILRKRHVFRIFLIIHCLLPFIHFSIPKTSKACHGRFVNPMIDIYGFYFLPISIGPEKIRKEGRKRKYLSLHGTLLNKR